MSRKAGEKMSGAQTSLSLQDRMTGPLMKIMKALDSTITTMEKMDQAAGNLDSKSLANARKSIDNATADLTRMQSALKTTGDSASKTAEQQQRMNESLNRMKPPSVLERMRSMYQGLQREMAQATTVQQKFAVAANTLRPSNALEKLKSVMKQHGDSADRASGFQQKFNQAVQNGLPGLAGLTSGLLGAIGAYKLFNAAKAVVSDLFSRGIEFHAFKESAEVAFTTFLGDAAKAKAYMDDMYAFALKTPFAYPDLLASSRNLIAFGMTAENTFPVMQAIGDAVASIGGGNAEMMNMADIFGQIQSQGRITAMEINRLSQYGINGFEILGKAAGKSAAQMRKEVSKGTVDAGTAIAALVNGINDKFGGMMENMKKSWAGLMDTLNSAKRNAGAALTKDLMGPLAAGIAVVIELINKIPQYIGPAVNAFIPLIEMFEQTFSGDRFDGVFAALGASITFVANMLSWMGQMALWVAGIFADNWSWIAPFLVVLGSAIATITGILLFKYTVLGLIRIATLAWEAAQWAVNAAYAAFPGTWILIAVVAVIALIIYAMVAWADTTAAVVGYIAGAIGWLGQAFTNTMVFVANLAISAAEFFANAWSMAIYLVQLAWIAFNVFVRMVFDAVGNTVLRVAEFFMNKWSDATYAVQMAFHAMAQGAMSVMSGMAQGVVGVVNAALGAVSNLINAAVSGLNSLISMVNNIPGVNIGAIGTVDLKMGGGASLGGFSGLSIPAPQKKAPVSLGSFNSAGNYAANVTAPSAPKVSQFDRMEYGSTSNAFDRGYDYGSGLSTKASEGLTSALDKVTGLVSGKDFNAGLNAGEVPNMDYDPTNGVPGGAGGADKKSPGGKKAPGGAGGKGKNPTGGKLDKVGKIEDDINIADEDLKMLRDLAEREVVRKVQITLHPSVKFEGTVIKETADADKIIEKINKTFDDDFARSVEGVYSQ